MQQDIDEADDPEVDEKEMKRKQLVELLDYINSNQKVFDEENLEVVVDFVSADACV